MFEFDPLQSEALDKHDWGSIRLHIWSHFSHSNMKHLESAGAFVSAFFFGFLETPQLSLMTVDLVAFYGSIISVSINDKELLIEVSPA